jgi:hypothetical protein
MASEAEAAKANAFKDTRMESLQTFADIFGIKELGEQKPDTDTAVHIATVQGMVQRALYPGEDEAPPPVDQYDCADKNHRRPLGTSTLGACPLKACGEPNVLCPTPA